MRFKTIHKIQIVVFSLTFLLGCILLVTNYSYGSDVLGTNTEEMTIRIPFDKNYFSQLENTGLTIKVIESGEYTFRAENLGIKILDIPNDLQSAIDKRPEATIQINIDRFENIINKIAETIRTDQLEGTITLLGNQLIYTKGEVGKVMLKDNAIFNLLETLENNETEMIFGIAKQEDQMADKFRQVKDNFEFISNANYWIRFDDKTIKISNEDLVDSLEVVNNRITANREKLNDVLNDTLRPFYKTSKIEGINDYANDTIAQIDGAISKIIDDIESRNVQNHNLYTAEKIEVAGTNGEFAERYSEVDLSQQKMYVWQDRKKVKEYIISSGKNNWTPTGEFEILNKAPNTFSTIFQKWMPYWMAFSYLPRFKSYAGFHELTYWKDAEGKYVYDSEDNLGIPLSGGCVRLGRGEAKEFYEMSEIGDKVLIHE